MVEMHETIPGIDRYHELGQVAFAEKLGLWIVVPQQLTVEVSTCIVYMVTGGKLLKKFQISAFPNQNIPNYIFYSNIWLVPLHSQFASQPEFHLWGFLGCCFHVLEVIICS